MFLNESLLSETEREKLRQLRQDISDSCGDSLLNRSYRLEYAKTVNQLMYKYGSDQSVFC